jgi:hypothetical protein
MAAEATQNASTSEERTRPSLKPCQKKKEKRHERDVTDATGRKTSFRLSDAIASARDYFTLPDSSWKKHKSQERSDESAIQHGLRASANGRPDTVRRIGDELMSFGNAPRINVRYQLNTPNNTTEKKLSKSDQYRSQTRADKKKVIITHTLRLWIRKGLVFLVRPFLWQFRIEKNNRINIE